VKSRAELVAAAALVAMLLAAPEARAHDPFQITSDARVHADRIDLKITMAERTALALCRPTSGPAHPSSPPEIEKLRAELESCGAGLYRLTAGGEPLVARRARVVLTEESDVETSLVYPPPGQNPLVFDAVHLTRLSNPTYGAELTVTGDGTFLGQKLLRADDSALSVEAATTRRAAPSFGHLLRLVALLLGLVGICWLVARTVFS
jgi:hypothetical protein